jgi:hypothetical protein
MKTTKQEKGILTEQDLIQAVNRFIEAEHWEPGQERMLLSDLHKRLTDWLGQNNFHYSVQQRKFSGLLTELGFRTAYSNFKSKSGWAFRKIIFVHSRSRSES